PEIRRAHLVAAIAVVSGNARAHGYEITERYVPELAPGAQIDGDERAKGRLGAGHARRPDEQSAPKDKWRADHRPVLVAEPRGVARRLGGIDGLSWNELHAGGDGVHRHDCDLPNGVPGETTPVSAADVPGDHERAL